MECSQEAYPLVSKQQASKYITQIGSKTMPRKQESKESHESAVQVRLSRRNK